MKVTLIHNVKAGDERAPRCEGLVDAIGALGWKVTVVEKARMEGALRKPGDAVLVAGGDGTVGKVAKRLAGTGVPMAVIPTGTANNVARTLGIGIDPQTAIASLRHAVVREIDLGSVRIGESDIERFLEGFGVGLFAWVMAERATRKSKKLRRAFGLIAEALETYAAKRTQVGIDGRDASGDYLLAAVMNLRSLGPALALAPDARCDDGVLDVVLVRQEHREGLLAHLKRAASEGEIALPRFEIHRARHVRLSGHGRWAHVDDCSRELDGEVEIRVEPKTVRFLAPPETVEAVPG